MAVTCIFAPALSTKRQQTMFALPLSLFKCVSIYKYVYYVIHTCMISHLQTSAAHTMVYSERTPTQPLQMARGALPILPIVSSIRFIAHRIN